MRLRIGLKPSRWWDSPVASSVGNHRLLGQESLAIFGRWDNSRVFLYCGLGLIFLGLFHVGVWAILGGSWEGPVAWRKPILFGMSMGTTVISVGWVFDKLARRPQDRLLVFVFCFSMTLEVMLITLQPWRGVASHFNRLTPLDETIDLAMTAAISIAFVALLDIFLRCFGALDVSRDMKLAIRAGFSFLIVSCLIGFGLLFHGNIQLEQGDDPSQMGRAGVPKFPHGIAIHAIQWLPLMSWICRCFGVAEKERLRVIRLMVGATFLLLLFAVNQTWMGRARWDLSPSGWIILGLTAASLLPVPFIIMRKKTFVLMFEKGRKRVK